MIHAVLAFCLLSQVDPESAVGDPAPPPAAPIYVRPACPIPRDDWPAHPAPRAFDVPWPVRVIPASLKVPTQRALDLPDDVFAPETQARKVSLASVQAPAPAPSAQSAEPANPMPVPVGVRKPPSHADHPPCPCSCADCVCPRLPIASPQAVTSAARWHTLTNVPGWQGLGELNERGEVVVRQYRRVPAPVTTTYQVPIQAPFYGQSPVFYQGGYQGGFQGGGGCAGGACGMPSRGGLFGGFFR